MAASGEEEYANFTYFCVSGYAAKFIDLTERVLYGRHRMYLPRSYVIGSKGSRELRKQIGSNCRSYPLERIRNQGLEKAKGCYISALNTVKKEQIEEELKKLEK